MPVDIEALKRNPQCLRLYSSRLSLTKDGREYLASCCFHSEKSPSLKIYQHDGIWLFKCFGCNEAGNAVQFVQKKDNITFKEAIAKVQEEVGNNSWEAAKDHVDRVFQPPVAEEKSYRTLTLAQIAPLERNLANSDAAKKWLAGRGIALETAKRLHLGFKQDLGSLGTGLAPEVIAGGWLAFPCIEGDVVKGIKYRSLAIKTFRKQPNMATTLYNLDDIDPLEPVYLVEGEPDAAVLVQAGFRAVSLPSASTKVDPEMRDHLMAADSVVLAGDCDGGVGSAIMERLWRDLGDRAYLLKWPAGKKDANQTFLETCGGDVAKFRETVENLTVEAKGNPMPEFTSIQKALLSGGSTQMADHPLRLRLPWAGVDNMAVLLPGSVLMVSATNTSMGKALANGTRVYTPTGWKTIETLSLGDQVIGSDGKPTTVTGVFPQGEKPAYEVTFCDGVSIVCCDEHLWDVQSNYNKCVGIPHKVLTLRQIMDKGLRAKGQGYRFHIPMTMPVQFEKVSLPADPYLLGALLGDGSICNGSIQFTCAEEELVDNVRATIPDGLQLRQNRSGIQYRISKISGTSTGSVANPLHGVLRDLGLWGRKSEHKFIPEIYKFAAVEDRIALLQGLLDTDGSANERGYVHFCSVSQRLMDDVLFLVRSLGGTGTAYAQNRADGRKTLYYANLKMLKGFEPFRLSRKQARLGVSRGNRRVRPDRAIVNVKPVGSREMTCISVSALDQLYVTEHFLVTHNSQFVNQICVHAARAGEVVVNYQVEMTPEEIATITAAHVTKSDRNELTPDKSTLAARILKDAYYYVGNDPTLTSPGPVFDLLEKAVRRLGATVVVLDHIHFLCRGDNEIRDQAEASRRMKLLAQNYKVKFIAVGQPRKADSKSKGKSLHITDLKGSSSIGDDIDAFFALHRNVVQNPDPNNPPMDLYEPETEIHCLKARSRGRGAAFTKLYFMGALATFTDITHAEPPPAYNEE